VERYLRYAVDFREKFSCLLDPAPPRFDAFAKAMDSENLSLTLEITETSYASLLKGEVNRLENLPKDLRLSFAVNEALYFIHTRLVEKKSRQLTVAVDVPIFKLQRRNAVRIKVSESHQASIEVGEKTYIPHDLSASGLSFVVMPDQESDFIPKQIFRSCRLRFSSLDVPVDLEVIGVNSFKGENDRLLKVGFRFLGLTAAVEQHIAREAYLYTHKIWSRWI
jgi:c-di-GMP-binding flagellar brake protein YcgR